MCLSASSASARALNTEQVLLIARQTNPPEPSLKPLPVDTSGIPNDHLQYAVTWFLLAAIWASMTVYYIWRTAGRPAQGHNR